MSVLSQTEFTISDEALAERELLARFVAVRDAEAFRALVDRYEPAVRRACNRLLGRSQDVEDAVQATFLAFVEHAGAIRQTEAVGGWLYRVACRTSLRMRRRKARDRAHALTSELESIATAEPTSADENKQKILHEELSRLPRQYRDPLVLRYLGGQSVAAICKTLRVTPTVLKGRLQRGRRELRLRLSLRGVGLSLAALAQCMTAEKAKALEIGASAAMSSPLPGATSRMMRTGINAGANMTTTLNIISIAGCVAAMAFGFPTRTPAPASSAGTATATTAHRAAAKTARDVRIAMAPSAETKEKSAKVLKYGDDKPDGKKSLGGSGELIQFKLPAEGAKLAAIEIHGSRYGYPQAPKEDFKIYVLSEDRSKILHTELVPYSSFERGEEKWVKLKFAKAVDLPKAFWIAVDFNAEATKGVYVSYDTSTGGKHSMVGLPGKEAKKTDFGGDWMIRAELDK